MEIREEDGSKINSVPGTLTCRVVKELPAALVLGMSWLKAVNPRLDFATASITFGSDRVWTVST